MRTTDREVEGIVSNWLEQRVVDPPRGSLQAALARAEQTPQQHHRWLRWWFGRGPGATDGQMDRRLSSVTALFASVAVLALVAVLAIPRQLNDPPAPDVSGTTYSVAAENADFTTIAEAVAMAQDGDTVLVEPGTYEEALLIDKSITLAGNGVTSRAVIIKVPAEAPLSAMPLAPYDLHHVSFELAQRPAVGIQIIDTDATVRDLQVTGHGDAIDVLVYGGAPTLERLVLKHEGLVELNASLAGGLFVDGASGATIHDSTIWHRTRIGGGSEPTFSGGSFEYPQLTIQDGAAPMIADAVIRGDCGDDAVVVVGGSTPTFKDNWFMQAELEVRGAIDEATAATIDGNTFSSADLVAITISDDASATIEANSFTANTQGINVSHAAALIRGNSFISNTNAVTLAAAEAEVVDNVIRGGAYGLSVVYSGAPTIVGNTIENTRMRGILVAGGTSPTIDGNTVCGADINLDLAPNANPVIGHNDICPDNDSAGG